MDKTPDQQLDYLTRIIPRTGGISDDEAERIGNSPFLRSRLRAGIEAEQRRRTERRNGWFATVLVASRAIAVLMVVTITAVLAFWLSKTNAPGSLPPVSSSVEDISRVVIGGTCALSTTTECAISTEEVLATLLAEKREEEPK